MHGSGSWLRRDLVRVLGRAVGLSVLSALVLLSLRDCREPGSCGACPLGRGCPGWRLPPEGTDVR